MAQAVKQKGKMKVTRRVSNRLASMRSVCMIEYTLYPVVDWSMGGVQIAADPRLFLQNQKLHLTLKFKLHRSILKISCRAKVVRKTADRLGLKFESFDKAIHQLFLKVVDDYVSNEFAESQVLQEIQIDRRTQSGDQRGHRH